jgi:hypothetical protein
MCMACQQLTEDDMRYLAKLAAEAQAKAEAEKLAQVADVPADSRESRQTSNA